MVDTPHSIADHRFYDPAVDGLRGIAILSVILNHASKCAIQDPTRSFQFPLLLRIGNGGAGGVSLFFVLSARTLMISTHFRFSNDSSPRAAFYLRRGFRILPLWWIFILVSVFIRHPSENEILPHLFMYFGFFPEMNFTHVGWSLFVEETFYIIFPLIFTIILRPAGALLFFIIVLLLSDRVLTLDWNSNGSVLFQFLSHISFFHYVTFGLGIIGFHITGTYRDDFQKFASQFRPLIWEGMSILSFIIYLTASAHSNLQIAACFVLVLTGMIEGTLTRRLLSTSLLRTFGMCCYSIYLFHGLFLYSIRYTDWFSSLGAAPLSPDFQMLAAFGLTSIFSYFFGLFSFKYFELTCVHLGKKWTRKLGFSAS